MPFSIFKKLKKELVGNLKENEVLAGYTTFKIGGPARYFYIAKEYSDFIKAIKLASRLGIPYFILGNGSNILVSDQGFEGLVIKKKNGISPCDFKILKNKIIAGAGVKLNMLTEASVNACLTGMEWTAGIPGTIGGAVRGNAGAFDGQMADIVEKVIILYNNEKKILRKDKLDFSYRNSVFKKNKKYVILSVELKLEKGDKKAIKEKIKYILEKRHKISTPQYPTAGCVFKNPIIKNKKIIKEFEKDTGKKSFGKIPAGYLIDRLDLKGKKIGNAVVGDKNANFILNVGNATAKDVIILISLIKQKVRNRYNVQLEEEIELVGF